MSGLVKNFAYDQFVNLTVTDNYGIEYANSDISAYSDILGVSDIVSGVQGDGLQSLLLKLEKFFLEITVKEFLTTALTANGKSLTVLVSKN